MAQTSRIRFNPVTKEVEIEGTESFIKSYFTKIQNLFSEMQKPAKEQAARKATVSGKAAQKPPRTSSSKRLVKGAISSTVFETIKASEGMSVPALAKATGFTQQQVRSVIFKAEKDRTIRRLQRGVYVAS